MALYDSAELLTTIKNRAMIPANAGAWTDPELLRAASEEVDTWLLPLLVKAKGEFLVKEQSIPCVVDQTSYLISYRAAAVRSALLRWTSGAEQPIDELPPGKQDGLYLNRNIKGVPRFYAFREGYLDLYPKPDSTDYSVVLKWHISPNRIVETTDCRQITAAQVGTPSAEKTRLVFTVSASAAMAGGIGAKYDFVGYRKPFTIKGWDVACTSVVTVSSSIQIDFLTADLPTDLLIGTTAIPGDWICPSQKTPHPNIPHELHSAIGLRAAAAACASRNPSLQGMLVREATAKEAELLGGILQPRNKGAVKRLVQRRW